jgi:flagellar hook-basal body complex protein FliE
MRPIGFPSPPTRPPMPSELARAGSMLSGQHRLAAASPTSEPFAVLLAEKINELAAMQVEIQQQVRHARHCPSADGGELLTAVQKSDLALSTMLQVRDKLIEAFREIQQIQI